MKNELSLLLSCVYPVDDTETCYPVDEAET